MAHEEQFAREVIERLARIETKQDSHVQWQQNHEKWSQVQAANIAERLGAHDAIINRGKGVFIVLQLLWGAILAWFGYHHPSLTK